MAEISVIIPVYNAEEHIIRCLDSICRNTYKNLEIICINDGSQDKSSEIIHEYQQSRDQRVRVIDQPNRGVSTARNIGMQAAEGTYIAFIDSDDWIHQKYFEYLLKAIEYVDIAHCDMKRVSEFGTTSDEELYSIKILDTKMPEIERITDHCWGKLFRKSVIQDLNFAEHIAFGEDKLFTTLALQKAHKVAIISNQLYFYYNNPSSAVNTKEHDLYLPAVEFLQDAKENNHPLSLKYAYTGFMSYRYINTFKSDAVNIRKKCNSGLKECQKLAPKLLPKKQQLLLWLFANNEALYRLYRIATDKTMIDWERSQKNIYFEK